MSSWAEIRRLQAALDEVQASSTSHKLSERNCIEVVSKLVEMGLVSVLYTLDGKEYVVTSYLETEIRNELQAHRGRREVYSAISTHSSMLSISTLLFFSFFLSAGRINMQLIYNRYMYMYIHYIHSIIHTCTHTLLLILIITDLVVHITRYSM